MPVVEREKSGPHRWVIDWCPMCKERMTFWFVGENRMKCSQCASEKVKEQDRGLGLDSSIFED
jgi:hypothetical protein